MRPCAGAHPSFRTVDWLVARCTQSTRTRSGGRRQPFVPQSQYNGVSAHSSDEFSSPLLAIEQLRLMQQLSEDVLNKARVPPVTATPTDAPRTVDIRMYEQISASRNRLSKKLSEVNRYANYLEGTLDGKDDVIMEAYQTLIKVSEEFSNLKFVTQSAAASVKYGLSREEAVDKVMKLEQRLDVLEHVVANYIDALQQKVPREVPVAWYGLASEVKLMGEFDGWTQGQTLTSDSVNDNVFSVFEGRIKLVPGRYRVKFLVDGEWRLGNGWPTENDESGETNNVIVVD